MADDSEKLSGAEEYVAAEIELAEPLDPEQEKNLRDALGKARSARLRFLRYRPEKDFALLRPDPDIARKDCSSSSSRPAANPSTSRAKARRCYKCGECENVGRDLRVPPYSRPRACRLSRANLNPPNDSAAGNSFVSAEELEFHPEKFRMEQRLQGAALLRTGGREIGMSSKADR